MTLLEKYIIARWCYAIGEFYIDDIEYGILDKQMKEQYPDNEYVNRSWSDDPCPIELLEKYGLQEYYRDIKFAYKSESIRSLNSWEEVEAEFANLNEPSRLSFKIDGFNMQKNHYNKKPISSETRGRTGNSLNANSTLSVGPQEIPYGGKVKVTGEMVIPNDKWRLFQLEYDNVSQRSSVSTCLANGLTDYLAFVAFDIKVEDMELKGDQYKILNECGFETPFFMTVNNYAQLKRAIELMGQRKQFYNFPTDGLVLENSKQQVAIRVGAWQEHVMQSYVTEYVRNTGLHNNPILVKIAPVRSSEGHTHTEVSVTNLQYILDCDLKIGSPIAFDLRSMAAPVLNTTITARLHSEYEGKYEEYRKQVDERYNNAE